MTSSGSLGAFLLIAGLILSAGPAVFFYLYDRGLGRAAEEDLLDDNARRLGTFFFMVGGISFIAGGLFLLLRY